MVHAGGGDCSAGRVFVLWRVMWVGWVCKVGGEDWLPQAHAFRSVCGVLQSKQSELDPHDVEMHVAGRTLFVSSSGVYLLHLKSAAAYVAVGAKAELVAGESIERGVRDERISEKDEA